MDRFGACSACPTYGFVCENDTAILAPDYFWKWSDQTLKRRYESFVNNIHSFGSKYNDNFSTFTASLPKPIKCIHANSCRGGINSECQKGYTGILCASCTNGFYLRFNTCLKCPRLTVTIISSSFLIVLFVAVFLMVLWGDSKQTENNRTIADIIMSCIKIVIGFYQVIAGIFSALARVRWPVALISMEKYLNLLEGNILQFAPLSCIHSRLRIDQFAKFVGIISLNVVVVFKILLYLFLKKKYIKTKVDCPDSEKLRAVSSLKKSCYRNIFLFLLTSYSTTSKTIIQTLPLPGACVETCFTDVVLVTQRIYSRLHSLTQHFVFTAFDMHRFTTLARKHEGTTRESRDATNTIAGYPRGTITSQVCSVSYLVYPSGCNGL